jgi:prepilin signal peptidase PulO-like enzyme (type II secretory pathway)
MVFMDITIGVSLAVLGLVFGSFAGAQVWRLRAKQLVEDKVAGEAYDAREYKRLVMLTKHHGTDDRSRCLACGHTLAWYDLVPLLSWLSVSGKCRYCRRPIGAMEPLVELGVAAAFVFSYLYWPFALATPLEWLRFGLWLVAVVLMAILFMYDAKWSLLPFGINITLVVVALAFFIINLMIGAFDVSQWWSLVGSIAILAGLYFLFSLAGWVGLGDSILGFALALLLMSWEHAFLALFLANLLGCLALIPLVAQRKLKRGTHIPFGPFLILGAIISLLWGHAIISFVMGGSDMLLNSLMV